jgi:hypothetical protein
MPLFFKKLMPGMDAASQSPDTVFHVFDTAQDPDGYQDKHQRHFLTAQSYRRPDGGKHPDNCRRSHPPYRAFLGNHETGTKETDTRDDLGQNPILVSACQQRLRMLVLIPAGLPRICRSRPIIPPHNKLTRILTQNSKEVASIVFPPVTNL